MYRARYWASFSAGQVQLESKKNSNAFFKEHVALLQNSAVDNLLQKKRGGVVVSGSSVLTSSTTPFSRNSGAASTCTTVSSFTGGRKNSPFAFSSQRSIESTMKMDIRQLNNATVEMAIADFFHCKNIPDAVVESPRFVRLVRVCRLVRDDFVLPNQRRIGGDLIDINYTNGNYPSNASHEHPCNEWRHFSHEEWYSRLFKAHGRGREEGCIIHCRFV